MPHSALTLPRLVLLCVLGCAGLVWAIGGIREPHHRAAVARADNPFSIWGALRRVGCAPPNEHGTFIALRLRRDEAGAPYIFECTRDGLALAGRSLR